MRFGHKNKTDKKNKKNKKDRKTEKRSKNRIKRIETVIAVILLMFSVVMIAYPIISNILYDMESENIISSYTEKEQNNKDKVEEFKINIEAYNSLVRESRVQLTDPFINDVNNTLYQYSKLREYDEVMGTLEIPAISLKVPIYFGTDEDTLHRGVGHLNGSSIPSSEKSVHSVLCGHTGYSKARLFTDLDTMELEDKFYIYINGKILAYEVDEITVVEPDDVSKLKIIDGENYVTLYTCTPYGENTHRLLVRGKNIEYNEDEYQEEQESFLSSLLQSHWVQEYLKALGFGIACSLALFFILNIIGRIKAWLRKRK